MYPNQMPPSHNLPPPPASMLQSTIVACWEALRDETRDYRFRIDLANYILQTVGQLPPTQRPQWIQSIYTSAANLRQTLNQRRTAAYQRMLAQRRHSGTNTMQATPAGMPRLPLGTPYMVRSAASLLAPPVAGPAGHTSGNTLPSSISLPMTGAPYQLVRYRPSSADNTTPVDPAAAFYTYERDQIEITGTRQVGNAGASGSGHGENAPGHSGELQEGGPGEAAAAEEEMQTDVDAANAAAMPNGRDIGKDIENEMEKDLANKEAKKGE